MMISAQRLTRSRQIGRHAVIAEKPSNASHVAGRVIQVALAIYLLPALLVVLSVGSVGMLVLAGRRLVSGVVRAPLA
jgi:hypothetical protein